MAEVAEALVLAIRDRLAAARAGRLAARTTSLARDLGQAWQIGLKSVIRLVNEGGVDEAHADGNLRKRSLPTQPGSGGRPKSDQRFSCEGQNGLLEFRASQPQRTRVPRIAFSSASEPGFTRESEVKTRSTTLKSTGSLSPSFSTSRPPHHLCCPRWRCE